MYKSDAKSIVDPFYFEGVIFQYGFCFVQRVSPDSQKEKTFLKNFKRRTATTHEILLVLSKCFLFIVCVIQNIVTQFVYLFRRLNT